MRVTIATIATLLIFLQQGLLSLVHQSGFTVDDNDFGVDLNVSPRRKYFVTTPRKDNNEEHTTELFTAAAGARLRPSL